MINYKSVNKELDSLCEGVSYDITLLANACALLYKNMDNINWLGFYILKDNELLLGPFQGNPACVKIQIGKGVCGTCIKEERTIVVDNVHEFPGHIACDERSKSEIVIPIYKGKKIYGVLDIDSPVYNRFDDNDREGLEESVKIIEKYI